MATELKTQRPPGSELASQRMDEAIERAIAGSPIYPNGTVFVGADMAGLGDALARHARERKPVLLVFPDGEERLIGPLRHRRGLRARLPTLRRRG